MENSRVHAIADAAARLFIQQGYSKTQISHIAKAVGVSVGTIYHDFTSKQAIMQFVLASTIDFHHQELPRPITEEPFHGLMDEISTTLENNAADFSKHLLDQADGYSFSDLISDTFDFLSKYAVGCLFIEKNQFDFPRLASSYRVYRQKFLNHMTAYLALYIQKGVVRPLDHIDLSTTLIIELLTWWAMDVRYLSFDNRLNEISPELAKEICMDNIIAAYALPVKREVEHDH